MPTRELAPVRAAVQWHVDTRTEWEALAPSTKTRAKVAILVAITVLAYHYTLATLVATAGLDTPLAYVGLVPFFAAGLAWAKRAPRSVEPPIHDRQLDYTLGLPLVAVATAAGLVLPGRLGAMYWVDRVDLLFLPVFVAGATVLLFGARVAWRQKAAIAYLWLAWPWPYSAILLGALGGFRSLTVSGMRAALHAIPVATASGGGTAALFQVVHHGRAFPISVVTACAGVDGMVGFLLVGLALASVVHGNAVRKGLWLATGMVLLWVTNLLRLLVLFVVGTWFGPHMALGVVHPYLGLVTFAIGVGLITLALRPFGLRPALRATDRPVAEPRPDLGPPAAPRVLMVASLLVVAGLMLSFGDASLRSFSPVASASGQPRLGSFLARPATPAGWSADFETEYSSNKPLFGETSRWFRYLYVPTSPGSSSLHSTLPVTADIIDAASLDGFESYGVTACYSFHGYKLRGVDKVDLGDGVSGQALSYSGGTVHQNWSIVYWILPVKTATGTRYERVILYLQNTGSAHVSVTAGGAVVSGGGLDATDPVQHQLIENRSFLVAFARRVIAGQSTQADAGEDVTTVQPPGAATVAWLARTRSGHGPHGTVVAIGHDEFWHDYALRHPHAHQPHTPGVAASAAETGSP